MYFRKQKDIEKFYEQNSSALCQVKLYQCFSFLFIQRCFCKMIPIAKQNTRKKKKFHDSQVIPYSGNILSSSENSKNIKAN